MIYKTLTRPILMFWSETWTLTLSDELWLCNIKRKILFKVCGPMQETGEWSERCNPRIVQALLVTGWSCPAMIGRAVTMNGSQWNTQKHHRFQTGRKESKKTYTLADGWRIGWSEEGKDPKMEDGHQGETVVLQGSTGSWSSSWIVLSLMIMTGSHNICISQSI
jgi:hypothetical protein